MWIILLRRPWENYPSEQFAPGEKYYCLLFWEHCPRLAGTVVAKGSKISQENRAQVKTSSALGCIALLCSWRGVDSWLSFAINILKSQIPNPSQDRSKGALLNISLGPTSPIPFLARVWSEISITIKRADFHDFTDFTVTWPHVMISRHDIAIQNLQDTLNPNSYQLSQASYWSSRQPPTTRLRVVLALSHQGGPILSVRVGCNF